MKLTKRQDEALALICQGHRFTVQAFGPAWMTMPSAWIGGRARFFTRQTLEALLDAGLVMLERGSRDSSFRLTAAGLEYALQKGAGWSIHPTILRFPPEGFTPPETEP